MVFIMGDLCIIPARGGSKRIPRKNIREFLGKPIIAYSIQTALDSGLFEEVMVSTDDLEIAKVAEDFGATVPFLRSKEKSDDFSPLAEVVEEVLETYLTAGRTFEFICCLLPTSPLTQNSDLLEARRLLENSNFDSVRPIVPFSYPIQRSFRITEGGEVDFFFSEFSNHRSQDLEKAYHDAGQFYWFRAESGMKKGKRGAIVISEKYAQDIDTLEDWEMAEWKFKNLRQI